MSDSAEPKRIATAWGGTEQWLRDHAPSVAKSLGAPVTDLEWQRALDVWPQLPSALRAFYGLHDGGEGALVGQDWFSIAGAIRHREIWMELLPQFDSAKVRPDAWFPFGGASKSLRYASRKQRR